MLEQISLGADKIIFTKASGHQRAAEAENSSKTI